MTARSSGSSIDCSAPGSEPSSAPGAVEQREQLPRLVVDDRFVDVARAYGGRKVRTEPLGRSRHLEIEAGVGGGSGAVRAVPVRHDDAVEAPLLAEQGAEQRVLAAERAVQPVVRRHQRPGARFAYRRLERYERDLAQCARIDLGADRHALELGVVGDEVLHRAADTGRLHTGDVRDGHARREERVLRVALEVAAGERMPVDVDGRRQQHVRALATRFPTDALSDDVHELGVPRRAERGAARERCRRASRPAFAARAGGSVGDLQRGHTEARYARGVPEVHTGGHRRLLVEGQVADERIDPGVHGGILA